MSRYSISDITRVVIVNRHLSGSVTILEETRVPLPTFNISFRLKLLNPLYNKIVYDCQAHKIDALKINEWEMAINVDDLVGKIRELKLNKLGM